MVWDAHGYDERFAFVTKHGETLVARLAPKPGERIIDLGCGTGHLTAEIAVASGVEGLDLDDEMLRRARSEHPEIAFRRADARTFTVSGRVDAVFSNAALHWIREPDQQSVLGRVHAALVPGGRFVAEMGGAGNVAALVQALTLARAECGLPPLRGQPWCFPTPAEQAARLEQAGFRVRSVEHFDRPTALRTGDTAASWLAMFGSHLTADVPTSRRAGFDSAVDRLSAAELRNSHGHWHADYVRLRWYATA